MSKKMTAVEFLAQKFEFFVVREDFEDMVQEAKEIEQGQIEEAYVDGGRDVQDKNYKGMKHYYEQRYKK